MSEPLEKKKRANISFRFRLSPNSRYVPLTAYYNSEKSLVVATKQEKVLMPMDAYWMPFALREMGASAEEVREAALGSIYRLSMHIQLLKETFGLLESMPVPQPINLGVSQPTTPSELKQDLEEDDDLEPDYDYDVSDFSADDDILNQFT